MDDYNSLAVHLPYLSPTGLMISGSFRRRRTYTSSLLVASLMATRGSKWWVCRPWPWRQRNRTRTTPSMEWKCRRWRARLGRQCSVTGFIRCIWVGSQNCGCLVTWFCYHLIAKPGNKTAAVPWPDPSHVTVLVLNYGISNTIVLEIP